MTVYEYKFDCEFRKPKPDMLLQAAKDFNIDYMIGDSERDVEAGLSAGCFRSIQIETNAQEGLMKVVKEIVGPLH